MAPTPNYGGPTLAGGEAAGAAVVDEAPFNAYIAENKLRTRSGVHNQVVVGIARISVDTSAAFSDLDNGVRVLAATRSNTSSTIPPIAAVAALEISKDAEAI